LQLSLGNAAQRPPKGFARYCLQLFYHITLNKSSGFAKINVFFQKRRQNRCAIDVDFTAKQPLNVTKYRKSATNDMCNFFRRNIFLPTGKYYA